jgi:hypothetical protein
VTELRLALTSPERVPLDEVLVVAVRLVNDASAPVTTSSRLDLAEGDLDVVVQGPDRKPRRAGWPWPVDSALRQVELKPGQALECGALLLSEGGTGPLFPVAGSYTLVGSFTPIPVEVVRSEPVRVMREEPVDDEARARRRALQDRNVAQSLAAASVMGTASTAVAALADSGPPVARLLARLAGGDVEALARTAADVVGETDSLTTARAVASVLPAGLYPGDERREAVASALSGHDETGRALAVLTGQPYPPP